MSRLLLVDDEEDVLDVMAEYLRAVGHDVTPESSGRRARDRILDEAARFDLALVDWMLPDVPGRELVLLLQRHKPACKVLLATAHGDDVVSDAIVGANLVGILRKPFTMNGVRAQVEAALGKGPPARG